MRHKLILTDVDGVLLNWNDAFDQHMLKLGHTLIPEHSNKYSLSKRFGVDRVEMDTIVSNFNESDHVKNLPPFRDSIKGVNLLMELGYRFVAITNIGGSKQSAYNRTHNLNEVFGDGVFEEIICLPMGESKYKTLMRWEGNDMYWIEDKFSNALDGHSLGFRAVLVDAEYNRDFSTTRFPRVSNETPWADIISIMVKDYFKD